MRPDGKKQTVRLIRRHVEALPFLGQCSFKESLQFLFRRVLNRKDDLVALLGGGDP